MVSGQRSISCYVICEKLPLSAIPGGRLFLCSDLETQRNRRNHEHQQRDGFRYTHGRPPFQKDSDMSISGLEAEYSKLRAKDQ